MQHKSDGQQNIDTDTHKLTYTHIHILWQHNVRYIALLHIHNGNTNNININNNNNIIVMCMEIIGSSFK